MSSNYKRSSMLYLRKSEGNFENSLILYKICSTKLFRYFVYDSIKLGLLWLLLLRFMSDVAHRPLVFPRQFLFLSVSRWKKQALAIITCICILKFFCLLVCFFSFRLSSVALMEKKWFDHFLQTWWLLRSLGIKWSTLFSSCC